MHNKYPVIKKLLLVQIISIGIGMLCIYLIMSYQAKDIISATIAKENSRIAPKIEDNQEMWRAWHALGMRRAFDADVNIFKNEFPIKSIGVVSGDQVQLMRNDGKFTVPSGDEEDSYVVYELDRKKLKPK
jgi:hypothetical protein